jgi:hypothetical protein
MAYTAKKAFFDELKARSAVGMELEGVQVAYSYPARDTPRVCIYGGGIRFRHLDLAEEINTVGQEVISIGMYIRVLQPEGTVRTCDEKAEQIADTVIKIFTDKPYLAGQMTWLGVEQGNADYAETPDGPQSVLSLDVMVGALLV